MPPRRCLARLAALTLVAVPAAGAGADTPVKLTACSDQWPPFVVAAKGGTPSGLFVDLVRGALAPAGFDLVVYRAFSSIPQFAGLALPVLKPDGCIIAMKGRDGEREAQAARDELAGLGLTVCDIRTLVLPADVGIRTLVSLRRLETQGGEPIRP